MAHDTLSPGQHASDEIGRYAIQSRVTDPGPYAHLYDDLPPDLPGICRSLQGLLVHYRSGIEVPPERLSEIDTRRVEAMLARIVELDPSPLTVARPPVARLV